MCSCELCCGATWAVKTLALKQQQSSAVVLLEVLSVPASYWWEWSALVVPSVQSSYRTRTRQSGCSVLLKWCRRNVADSSTIYSDVLRAIFRLDFAAALLPELNLRSLISSVLAVDIFAVIFGCWLPGLLWNVVFASSFQLLWNIIALFMCLRKKFSSFPMA